jgi:hypothetical protein
VNCDLLTHHSWQVRKSYGSLASASSFDTPQLIKSIQDAFKYYKGMSEENKAKVRNGLQFWQDPPDSHDVKGDLWNMGDAFTIRTPPQDIAHVPPFKEGKGKELESDDEKSMDGGFDPSDKTGKSGAAESESPDVQTSWPVRAVTLTCR